MLINKKKKRKLHKYKKMKKRNRLNSKNNLARSLQPIISSVMSVEKGGCGRSENSII